MFSRAPRTTAFTRASRSRKLGAPAQPRRKHCFQGQSTMQEQGQKLFINTNQHHTDGPASALLQSIQRLLLCMAHAVDMLRTRIHVYRHACQVSTQRHGVHKVAIQALQLWLAAVGEWCARHNVLRPTVSAQQYLASAQAVSRQTWCPRTVASARGPGACAHACMQKALCYGHPCSA